VRRLFQILLLAGGLALIAVAALPWWLGAALRPLAAAQGATFSRYERVGYGRFRLHDVAYSHGAVRVTADQVEVQTPLAWLLRPGARQASVNQWRVEITPKDSAGPKSSGNIHGMPSLHGLLEEIATALARWLPAAEIGPGEVSWPGQTLVLAKTEWKDRSLTVHGLSWRNLTADVTSSWPAQGPVAVHVTAAEGKAELAWSGGDVKGTATLWGQPLRVETLFPAERWVPESADLTAPDWTLPAERLKLGPQYASVRGHAHLAWSRDHFVVSAQAAATPQENAPAAPPFEAQLEAQGNTHGATITALHVAAPFATADLSAPVTLDYAQGFQAGSAQLTVQADLAKQSWFAAQGQVSGVIGVSGAGRQAFTLECTGLQFRDLRVQRAAARGTLQWPQLDVTELDLQLDATNRLTARGGIDLVTHELAEGNLQADLAGSWFERWLPDGARWNKGSITATFSGPLAAPVHAGKATVTGADLSLLQPMDLGATWRGRGAVLDDFSVRAVAGHASLSAEGALDPRHVQLRALTLERPAEAPWSLAAPADIAWAPDLHVGPLRLAQGDSFVSVGAVGGLNGTWLIEAAAIESSLFRDWLVLPGPDWRVHTLRTEGKLTEGKLAFTTQLTGLIRLQPQAADVRLLAHGDAKGIQLDELSTRIGERVVTNASGHLPITWDSTVRPHLQVDWKAPLAIEARTTPDSPLWTLLSDYAGMTIEEPVAEVKLGGTLEEPTGELRVKATRVAVAKNEFKERIPEITQLTLEAHANRSGVTIDTFAARIDDQAVQAHGKLPAGRDDWNALRQDPLAFIWQHGEGHIDLADADLARLAKRAPDYLAPQGRLSANLDLASGGALSGALQLRGAALRPIDPLGVVQEIDADLALANRQLEIKSWSAKLGGEPVEVRGTIELPPGGKHRVDLELKGKNLPLVRRTGLIVRCDLALAARTDRSDRTQVTGTVLLRDTVVLADLSVLRPTGRSTARRQPPYFSVEVEPFRDWTLGVDLRGPRAIRIHTPVFQGVATARFRLGGTLGEPRAVGEVTVDEGRVLFPFATFTVQLGAIRLSEADPYHPQLSVNAQSRYHDYLLRLEASGPLESPHILLSSNPSLEAAQLLLMVTSGQSPETDQAAATGTQRLARLGTYLGQGLILGSGSDESRIELSSGSRVSRQGRETYEFTYRLDDRWALVGEYDEYDEYNAGVKWRAYVQEGDTDERKK